jgi:uncharacterized protein YjgD (DUF1641 family)
MEELGGSMDQSMADLNRKLDTLTEQVAYLAEQARLAELARQSNEELLQDMTPIAKDVMRLATEQFEEVQNSVKIEDLLRMVKKLLRHGPQLEMLLDQLASLTDLLDTFGPIIKEGVVKTIDLTGEMESKGYFRLARGGAHLMDRLAASISEEDLSQLGDTLALTVKAVKEMPAENVSILGLARQMQDPAVRRGLALTLRMLQVIGTQSALNYKES